MKPDSIRAKMHVVVEPTSDRQQEFLTKGCCVHSLHRLKDRLHRFMREMTVDLLKDKTDQV